MIMTVEELKRYISTGEEDSVLEAMLQALELLIRKYTNNNFQDRNFRVVADIASGIFLSDSDVRFKEGDTVQVSDSNYNKGLFTVKEPGLLSFKVKEETVDELEVLVTKVVYPADVKIGVVNMLKYDLENRAKVGIQSETISRHSVTYFDQSASNTSIGYPVSLVGFLKPYMKARF
jgi:hypothetical protein